MLHIEDEIKAKQAELDELIKRRDAGPWVPTEEYLEISGIYFINAVGVVEFSQDWEEVRLLAAFGNVYKTRKEAEFESARMKALVDVNKIITEENLVNNWVVSWNNAMQNKLSLRLHHFSNRLDWNEWTTSRIPYDLLYFSPEAYTTIKARITQEQIDLIWRLN